MARFSFSDWLSGTAVDESGHPAFVQKVQVTQADGTANPATVYTDQQGVTATATALTAQALVNGIVLTAKSTNANNVFVGFDNTVTTTDDGTAKGYRLVPGQSISFGVTNASAIWIIGTAGDVIYVAGN